MIDKQTILNLEAMPIEGVAKRLGMEIIGHKTLCPWHNDNHPSLTFNTYRNRFKCFVCDAHGGVIDLVRGVLNVGFCEACDWLQTEQHLSPVAIKPTQTTINHSLDLNWLSTLMRRRELIPEAQEFLYSKRHINPKVAAWCGLSSTSRPLPCWRYGKAFYDAPSLLIPYYDKDGRLMSVQGRYLGTENKPRFRFPRGSQCHIYGMQILRYLNEGEELWITEGCSDCWAMLSAGKKAIAIPSATLLRDSDLEPITKLIFEKNVTLHMYPDKDEPGEKLFLQLRARLPTMVRHQLPRGCKDFSDYWIRQNE